jgi:beta-lactamase regulating signal transducer with metallopeptidase domain
MAWLVGVLLALGKILPQVRRLKRLRRQTIPAEGRSEEIYRQVLSDFGLTSAPELRIGSRLASPLLAGVFRPMLILPDDVARRFPEKDLRAIYAHELSHYRQRDVAWGAGIYSVTSLLWFHPLARSVMRSHERACEEVSDWVSASYLGDVEHYRRLLARLALRIKSTGELNSRPIGGHAMAGASGIRKRLKQLDLTVRRGPVRPARWRALVLLATVIVAGIGGVRLQAAGPKATPEASSPIAWIDDLSPISASDWNRARAAHLLERAGFGGTPAEIDQLAAMTPQQAVDHLINYEAIDDNEIPEFLHSGIYPNGFKFMPIESVVARALLTGKAYGVKAIQEGTLQYQPTVNEFYTLLVSEHSEMRRAGQWWAERMMLTKRPLQEKLTLFWHDHFATSNEKVMRYEKMLALIDLLRKNANGNFKTMLVEVSQNPAMLIWLDNKDNIKGKPNENYAREIMELFTMGEGQGYTEKDIRELARCLTGWTMTRDETVEKDGVFINRADLHDEGEKTIFGQTGKFDGHQAIDIILDQPAPSRYLTKKLYKYFVRENISPEMNDHLAKTLADAKYEIKPLLRTIFLSRDFYSPTSVGTHIKEPIQFIVSTYRKLGLKEVPGVPDFTQECETLGQVLFFPPNVAGWPGGETWINPATLLARGNLVHTLLFGDPKTYGHPDKVVAEGYRKIPLAFPQYDIKPHIWNDEAKKMMPVSIAEYDRFVASLGSTAMDAEELAMKKDESMSANVPKQMNQADSKSKMGQLSDSEKFNLAVGVYSGFVEAYNRVKPIERTKASIDFVALAKQGNVTDADSAVDYFLGRFLSVPLSSDRRESLVEFMKAELGGKKLDLSDGQTELILRRLVHLILSAPEYQLS